MGYQEVVIKGKNESIQQVMSSVKRNRMELFINLLGYHLVGKDKFYIFATDRHPGGDFLVENFNAVPMEDMIFLLDYEFIKGV